MKNLRILILNFVFAFSAFAVNGQGPIPNITDYRLDFTVAGIKGDSIKLSSLKGKVLFLISGQAGVDHAGIQISIW